MKKYILFGLSLFFFGVLVILFSPMFNVQKLIVSGNKFVSFENVSDTINFSVGQNIFLFNRSSAKKNLLKNYFVKDAKINIHLPNTLSVEIDERTPCCYIKYLNDSFLLIDQNAFIIEVAKSCNKNFPIATGLDFDSFSLGKTLEINNDKALAYVIQLSNLLQKNEIGESIVVDISDVNDIHLYVRNIDVLIGDNENLEQKISLLKSILDSNSVYLEKSGTLSIKNINRPPVFKFIT